MANREPDKECPICRDQFFGPVQTNCSHFYCAICFLSYWEEMSKWNGRRKGVDCPMCVQPVVKVIPWCWDLFLPEKEGVLLRKKLMTYNNIGRIKKNVNRCKNIMKVLVVTCLVICGIRLNGMLVVPGQY